MAFRRSTRRATRGVRKRAVWINIPFGNVNFTESVGDQLLLVPEDWESQFTGLANESATLRAIVGEIFITQTVAATAGAGMFWGMYITGVDATVVPTFTTAGMSEVDWLRTGVRAGSSSITASVLQSTNLSVIPIAVKAKRKLKSRDAIHICAQYGADIGSPAGIMGGLLRFLVARD